MPTYEYICKSCGHEFEKFQSITAEAIKKCPECGKNTAKRLIGKGAGVIFKGSGFYETDYRSESYQKSAKADKESGSAQSSSTEKSSKPASESKKTSSTSTDSGDK